MLTLLYMMMLLCYMLYDILVYIMSLLAPSPPPHSGNWAVAKKFADKNNYSVEAGAEMLACGLCDLVGSFFLSHVVAGGFARSAVNAESGAQTPLAGLISALLILVSLQLFTSLFFYLPLATLGAIIVVSVVSMMDFRRIVFAYQKGFHQDCVIMLGSLLCTFFGGVTVGLLCGVSLSVGGVLYATSTAEFTVSAAGGDGSAVDKHAASEKQQEGDDIDSEETSQLRSYRILKMSSILYFGNLDNFKESVQEAARSLVQSLRQQRAALPPPPAGAGAGAPPSRVLAAVVVDAGSWGHYLELPSAFALDELRLELLAPEPLYPPPSPSPSPPDSCCEPDATTMIVVKLGLVNCHPEVLKLLGALDLVHNLGEDMVFSSTADCLRNCEHRLQEVTQSEQQQSEQVCPAAGSSINKAYAPLSVDTVREESPSEEARL